MGEDIVRVLRVVEYIGPRRAVECQVTKSLHGAREFPVDGGPIRIIVATVGEFPEILQQDEWPKR